MDGSYGVAAARELRERSGVDEIRAGRPTVTNELSSALVEANQQANEIAGRLRNSVDALLGSEPEPGKSMNGAEVKQPPIAGGLHQLGEMIRSLNLTLSEARRQLDRLDRA